MSWLPRIIGVGGRLFFAMALFASGLQQLIVGKFVRLVPALPAWLPASSLWAEIGGMILLVGGLMMAIGWRRRQVTLSVGGLLGLVFLLYLPGVFANPGAGFMWTNPCKTLALLGGAILFAVAYPENERTGSAPRGATLVRLIPLGAFFLGIFLVVCGVQHFVYVDFVTQMVPAWMPAPRFWAYGTGVALIAGGVGVNLRPVGGLAAVLSGLMILLWVILLHIPRAFAHWPDAGETAGIFEALALSGTAFMLADRLQKSAMSRINQSGTSA